MKKIYIIVNPSAGTEEAVMSYIDEVFKHCTENRDVRQAHNKGDIARIIRQVAHDAKIIAIYGGDGSVCEAARQLYNGKVPLFILPGGTANVMAKQVNMPLDTKEALQLLACGNYNLQAIDMGTVNNTPFLLRVNMGILSDMITETPEEMKETWGQWAYGITAFKKMPSEGEEYILNMPGEKVHCTAVALTVTNAGNIGKKGYSFLPGISINDGLLDVIMLNKASLLSVIKVAGSILLHNQSNELKHWQVNEITIDMGGTKTFLCDDEEQQAAQLHIKVSPAALQIAIPKTPAA